MSDSRAARPEEKAQVSRPSSTAERRSPAILVLMGVAGSGKSTVMEELAGSLNWAVAEGDTFHSPANVAKMAAGIPLNDQDREPWLRSLAQWIEERERAGESALLTCSALKRSYRDILRDGCTTVCFIHLVGPTGLLEKRISNRPGHYMPVSLLDSQLDALEPLELDEPGLTLATDRPVPEVAAAIRSWLEYR